MKSIAGTKFPLCTILTPAIPTLQELDRECFTVEPAESTPTLRHFQRLAVGEIEGWIGCESVSAQLYTSSTPGFCTDQSTTAYRSNLHGTIRSSNRRPSRSEALCRLVVLNFGWIDLDPPVLFSSS